MTSSTRPSIRRKSTRFAAHRRETPRGAKRCRQVDTSSGAMDATISETATLRLWTTRELADFLGCSVRQIPRLREQGLPTVRVGFLVRFDPVEVRAWLNRRQEPEE